MAALCLAALTGSEIARILVRVRWRCRARDVAGLAADLLPHAVLFSVTRFRWISVDLA